MSHNSSAAELQHTDNKSGKVIYNSGKTSGFISVSMMPVDSDPLFSVSRNCVTNCVR